MGASMLAAATIITGCSQDPETEYQYVSLSEAVCSFLGTGNQPLVITVDASPAEWTAEPNSSWVKAEKGEDGTTLTITVDDNDSDAERNATITVTAANASQNITVYQLPADNTTNHYRMPRTWQNGCVVSPNGKWIAGFTNTAAGGDEWHYYPTYFNTETGEEIKTGPFSSSLFKCHQPWAVTDTGILYITDNENGGNVIFDIDGNYTISEPLEGYGGKKPNVTGVSADGTILVGWAFKKDGSGTLGKGLYHPLIWENGVCRELPMPDKDFNGKDFSVGVMVRGCSIDGKVIYGTDWDNSTGGMIYWKNGEVKYVGEDVRSIDTKIIDGVTYSIGSGFVCQAEKYKISPSGKYICGTYKKNTLNEAGSVVTEAYPAVFDTETEKSIIIDELTGECDHVTDDGIAFITIDRSCTVYDLDTRTVIGDMPSYVKEKYGLQVDNMIVNYVSPDGKVIMGTGIEDLVTGGGRIVPWFIIPPVS